METNVALVVLMGLPGAGKSTVCKKLKRYLETEREEDPQQIYVVHVCYDDLIPLSTQEKFVQFKQSENTSQESGENESCNTEHRDEESWKSARRSVYQKVEQLVDGLKSGGTPDDDILEYFNLSGSVTNNEASYVILLDDNFYYRSMRYEYFQLARKFTVGFCELYLECSVDVAMEQNSQREAQVPSEVIEAMRSKLEVPQPSEYPWESASSTLRGDNVEDLSGVWGMIRQCLKNPVAPLVDRTSEIAEARLLCSNSVAHQADIYLRSLVGQVIKEARQKGNVRAGELSAFSRTVNDGRQAVLSAVRDGSLALPPSLLDAVTDDNREEFYGILDRELRKKLP